MEILNLKISNHDRELNQCGQQKMKTEETKKRISKLDHKIIELS